MEINGIDVSKWQGDIDWARVRESGVGFAMIKATQGLKPDPKFRQNALGALNAGLHAGAYVYSKAVSADAARREAQAALELIGDIGLDYPVALDFESSHFGSMTEVERGDIITAFLGVIERAGFCPMLYSNRDWFKNLIPAAVRDEYPVWLASWRKKKPSPGFDLAMWQRGKGDVPGIEGKVDLDICYSAFSPRVTLFRLTDPPMRGEAFLAMQKALSAAGYKDADGKPLVPDGVWGRRSEAAFTAMIRANSRENA